MLEVAADVGRDYAAAFRAGIRFVARDPALAAAAIALLLLAFVAIVGPVVWTTDPLALDVGASLEGPSAAHPMGTDGIGRDILARFNEGARISLGVGVVVVAVGAVIGGLIGLVSGAVGGWLDVALMRVMDAILAFPPLVLAMAVTVGLGPGLENAALGIILTTIPFYGRLLRSEVLRIRSLPFIEAARAAGATRARIIGRHIVPHVISTLLIQGAAVFGYAILTLAALGFVGLGVKVPTPEWGTMITDGLNYALTGKWWIGVFPGLGVLLAVTAANILADRVRDILDPRGRYAHL
jgi:peptide/nickel transport system permease protein